MSDSSYEGRFNPPKDKDQLGQHIPTPGENKDHVLPYKYDDWKEVEIIQDGLVDPRFVKYKVACVGCGVTNEAVTPAALFDKFVKWLCDECRTQRGFAWASQVQTADQFRQYQIARVFPDDTLMRRLDRSTNPKDPNHDPFSPDSNRKKVFPVPDPKIIEP